MIENPYLKRKAAKLLGTTGRRSEKRIAKTVKGRQTPASGAMPGAKGDVVLPDWLMECKATESASMSVQHAWLSKIQKEAVQRGKQPALTVSFVDAAGRPVPSGEWVMIPLRLWQELCCD